MILLVANSARFGCRLADGKNTPTERLSFQG